MRKGICLVVILALAVIQSVLGDDDDDKPPPPLAGNLPFKACGEEASDCGEKFCGSKAGQFTTCGVGGVCHCVNQKDNYNGLTAKAFSDPKICKESKGNDPCNKKCKELPRTITSPKKAYICRVDEEDWCYCDFEIIKDKFAPCKAAADKIADTNKAGHKECKDAGICKDKPQCLAGESAGVPTPPTCKCTSEMFSAKGKDCKKDVYCYNTCLQGTAAQKGAACPSKSGKYACFCADQSVDTIT